MFIEKKNVKARINWPSAAERKMAEFINGALRVINLLNKSVSGGIILKMDNLDVPRVIAEKITKREIVKKWNYAYLQDFVSKGRVNRVIRRKNVKRLNILPDKGIKFTLMIDDIVERQLHDGDIVLFNRQTTLRLESMMAFKVKIVDGYAFRLGLFWTTSFNADFDGDEFETMGK